MKYKDFIQTKTFINANDYHININDEYLDVNDMYFPYELDDLIVVKLKKDKKGNIWIDLVGEFNPYG